MNDLQKHPDKSGYDDEYGSRFTSWSAQARSREEYVERYELQSLTPFCSGGWHLSGYGRGIAVRLLIRLSGRVGPPEELAILDAGCGEGGLSTYLACKGYNVIGVDISTVGCQHALALSNKFSLHNCRILNASLGSMSLDDNSIDFIIGLGTLHHFIKDPDVPAEFNRIMKKNAVGVFWDPFGENLAYRVFHDREKMRRLGDTPMTKRIISRYFNPFDMQIYPISWVAMMDKLLIRLIGWKAKKSVRKMSKVHHSLDRRIPMSSRLALWLSGQVITIIKKA